MDPPFASTRILGVSFFNDTLERAIDTACEEGGLVLAPSGPGLAELGGNPHYDEALRQSDLNLIDSGYLALLWQRHSGERIRRHSGLKFLQALLEEPRFRTETRQLWVTPSAGHSEATRRYLATHGIHLERHHFYVAPYYSSHPVRDPELLRIITETRPRFVILGIAGGKQEVLGHWLRDTSGYRPAILCIGAAIAFLSGRQAKIPPWADRLYLGWLLRILADPRTFLPRYWKARKLRKLLRRHGRDFPAQANPYEATMNPPASK